jgi:hypothetical protein
MSDASFHVDRYRALASRLAAALDAHGPATVYQAAEAVKAPVYKNRDQLPWKEPSPSTAPLAKVFPDPGALVEGVRAGDPAAVETALAALGKVAPEEAADLGVELVELRPWRNLADQAAVATSLSARREPFARFLEAVAGGARGGFHLRQSRFEDGCAQVLEKLQAAPIWSYEPVHFPTEAEWQSLPDGEREKVEERLSAGSSVFSSGVVGPVEYLLGYLGEKRCAAAQPLLAKLYREHPSRNLRLAAGHALVALGDPASLSLLASLAGEHDEWRRWFGIKAAILQEPCTAVERLGGDALLDEASRSRVAEAFDLLARDARDKAQKKVPGEPWILADKRWLGACARWSKERKPPGPAAAELLSYFPKEEVDAALAPPPKARPLSTKKASPGKVATAAPLGALEAFQAGRCDEAWKRLTDLGEAVREPAHLQEAREVARLTMVRARDNLQTIAERLRKAGYQFRHPGHVFVPPPADIARKVDELEAITGTLPIALRAAFEHLGAWLLNGDLPSWPKTANVELRPAASEKEAWLTDPFMMSPIRPILDDTEGWNRRGFFSVDFAADPLLKAGFSGGTYSILVPNAAADAPIEGHPHHHSFVQHLRTCLRYGGFAGWQSIPDRPAQLIDELTAGLLPI